MAGFLPKLDRPIPLFPLPNLVMFPHAIQFLHLFEDRYRRMMEDLLDTPHDCRFMATALLRPGYEAKYYTNHARIHDTVCVGLVARHECNGNGTYNLILRGLCRARVTQEHRDGPYREGRLEAIADDPGPNGFDAAAARCTLRGLINQSAFDDVPCVNACRDWSKSDLPLGVLLDLYAFHLLPDSEVELRQMLLDESLTPRRFEMLTESLCSLGRVRDASRRRYADWPPPEFDN